jgi:hypothetical protein
LYLIIASLTVEDDFIDVINRPLHLVDVLGFLLLHHQGCTDDLGGYHDILEEGLAGLW